MLEIDGYKIKRYRYGYELYEPYEGKTKINGIESKVTKHRLTYWPTLKHACVALLDRQAGKIDGVPMIVRKIEECTQWIIAATNQQLSDKRDKGDK